MTRQELDQYLSGMSDEALAAAAAQAKADLEDAVATQYQSEWHATCFAATVAYTQEQHRRNRLRAARVEG